jgi:hypothetical protein
MSDRKCDVPDGLCGVSHRVALGVGEPLGVTNLAQGVSLQFWL